MEYDASAVRAHIPALREGAAHFDGPGGTQLPQQVADAVATTLTSAIANRGTVTRAERRAEDIVHAARHALADLLGADPRGVIVGRSMTQLTYDAARALAKTWSPGDEVVVSRLDHDANIRPWVHAARDAGAVVRWADFDPDTAELAPEVVAAALSDRTRLVAVTAASNLIGTRPDIPEIAAVVRDAGALLYVDGVHATAHGSVDIAALGADFFACSPYKFLGPHCGVLAADPALLESLDPDKLAPSTDEVPERFELGTLPYELLAGCTATVDFLADLGDLACGRDSRPHADPATDRRARLERSFALVAAHEDRLRARIEEGLAGLGAMVYSRAEARTPTLLFRLPGVPDATVREHLAERGVNAPNGSFYAVKCSRRLGLGDTGAVRAGLAPYNNDEDVDRLLEALGDLAG